MRTKRIDITDELAEAIERNAQQFGLRESEYLTKIIERHIANPASRAPREWMPIDRWQALVRGEECSICYHLQEDKYINGDGYKIANLGISELRLSRNQFVPGYCVLFCLKHIREPYELESEDQAAFFDDMMRVGLALEKVFQPTKMNFELLGNGMPHLHCHINPRFHGDISPGIPIDQNAQIILLSPEEYEERIKLIRKAL
jgi:diadenosine tetraphosphate (Ap4A) HIT family hydrolase